MQSGDFGQPRLEGLLDEMLSRGRVSGSFLFAGPVGVGKEALAVELGRLLNCENEPRCPAKPPFGPSPGAAAAGAAGAAKAGAAKAAGTRAAARGPGTSAAGPAARCNSCHKFDLLQHPDLLLVFPVPRDTWDERLKDRPSGGDGGLTTINRILREKARNPYYREDFEEHVNIEADVLRDKVLPAVYRRPVEGRVKTVILSDCDVMVAKIANLLLKTLEEPPADCLLVLTTSVPQRLLSTVRSRCQRLRFAPLAPEWMQPRLQALLEESPAKARVATALSQGSMHLARRYLQGDLDELRDGAFTALAGAAAGEPLDLLELAAALAQQRREKRFVVPLFLELLVAAARDVLLVREGATGTALVNADRQAALEKLARSLDAPRLRAIMRDAERAEREIAGQALAEHALGRLFLGMAAAASSAGSTGRGAGAPAGGASSPDRARREGRR